MVTPKEAALQVHATTDPRRADLAWRARAVELGGAPDNRAETSTGSSGVRHDRLGDKIARRKCDDRADYRDKDRSTSYRDQRRDDETADKVVATME
jgi:hypothetical protein